MACVMGNTRAGLRQVVYCSGSVDSMTDGLMRMAAFTWLADLRNIYGDVVPFSELQKGFPFRNGQVRVLGPTQQALWRWRGRSTHTSHPGVIRCGTGANRSALGIRGRPLQHWRKGKLPRLMATVGSRLSRSGLRLCG